LVEVASVEVAAEVASVEVAAEVASVEEAVEVEAAGDNRIIHHRILFVI
jgi:hypothetical protein